MALQTITLFISSPGDVAAERAITDRVIKRLGQEFKRRVTLKPYFWEHEPLVSTMDFQGNIPRPSTFDIAVCILWARLGLRLGANWALSDGTLPPTGTEFEILDAMDGNQKSGSPALLIYRNKSDPLLPLEPKSARQERLRQLEALEAFADRFFKDVDGANRFAYASYPNLMEFEKKLENHLRGLITSHRKFAAADQPVTAMVQVNSWTRGSPFVGLRTFEFEDELIFHGRLQEIDAVRRAMVEQAEHGRAVTLIYGDSGSGKSSMARAGVMPLICKPGVVDGIGLWRRAMLVPSDPADSLAELLASALLADTALPEITQTGITREALVNAIKTAPTSLPMLLTPALLEAARKAASVNSRLTPPVARLVLLVDQMEQLFTQRHRFQAEDWKMLDAALAGLTDRPSQGEPPKVWVLGTMRSDFFEELKHLPELVKRLQEGGQYRLGAMDKTGLGQVIRLPALAAGLIWEEDARGAQLDQVLRDAMPETNDALPLLQFTLEQLFNAQELRNDNVLRHADFDSLVGPPTDAEGKVRARGLDGAIASHAERVFKQTMESGTVGAAPLFDSEEKAMLALRALARLLATLRQTGREALFVSRTANEAEAQSKPGAIELAEKLVTGHLLVAGAAKTWRVAHESLFRNWPRFAKLLEEEREFIDRRARAVAASMNWEAKEKHRDFLWSHGAPLEEAKSLAAEISELDASSAAFVEASVKEGEAIAHAAEEAAAAAIIAKRRLVRRLIIGAAALALLAFWVGIRLFPGDGGDPEFDDLKQQAQALRDQITTLSNEAHTANREETENASEDDAEEEDPYDARSRRRQEMQDSRLALQEVLRRLLEKKPEDSELMEERIALLMETGQTEVASASLKEMLRVRGSLPANLLRLRAEVASQPVIDNDDSEEGAYGNEQELSPQDRLAAATYAVECWQAYVKAAPAELRIEAWLGLSRAQGWAGDWAASQQTLQQAAAISRSPPVVAGLALAKLQQGEWEAALREWQTLPEDTREKLSDDETRNIFSRLGEQEAKLKTLSANLRKSPQDVQSRMERAISFSECGLDAAALSDAAQALSLMPDSAALQIAHARFLINTGKPLAASSLVSLNGDHGPYDLANTWESMAKMWKLDLSLAQTPGDLMARRERAALLGKFEQERLRVRDLSSIGAALKDKPELKNEYAIALLDEARALMALGDYKGATASCSASLAAAPTQEGEKLMESIRYAKPVSVKLK